MNNPKHIELVVSLRSTLAESEVLRLTNSALGQLPESITDLSVTLAWTNADFCKAVLIIVDCMKDQGIDIGRMIDANKIFAWITSQAEQFEKKKGELNDTNATNN